MSEQEPILWLRFIGEELDVKTLPIYEFGTVLISFQRIVNKAYLFRKGTLTKGGKLSYEERKNYALQIGSHQKSSDEYGFISFATDPVVTNHIKTLIVDGIVALGIYASYAVGKAIWKNKENSQDNQHLIVSIYNEVRVINDRINNIGGVDSIEIRAGRGIASEPVLFTTETQSYLRQLENETYRGQMQTLIGTITKLFPNILSVEIKVKPNYYTRVSMDISDFATIRYTTAEEDLIRFRGWPIYKLGQETAKILEFEAVSMEIINSESGTNA